MRQTGEGKDHEPAPVGAHTGGSDSQSTSSSAANRARDSPRKSTQSLMQTSPPASSNGLLSGEPVFTRCPTPSRARSSPGHGSSSSGHVNLPARTCACVIPQTWQPLSAVEAFFLKLY